MLSSIHQRIFELMKFIEDESSDMRTLQLSEQTDEVQADEPNRVYHSDLV